MKLPEIYTDWRIVVGFALIMLGAGNWIIGLQRTQVYSRIVASRAHTALSTDYRSFDELEDVGGGAVLAPLTAEQRQASYATARMDFYHATFLAGRVMVMIGVVLTLLGFIAIIQRDSRRAYRRPPDSPKYPPKFSSTQGL
ncbi:MAG: hypothetical protein JWM69_1138 [Candidatus Binatus sp.]|jgi:uncharacterized membrane protein|nr:hypothetical protein [Candidatus Binatus sp.]